MVSLRGPLEEEERNQQREGERVSEMRRRGIFINENVNFTFQRLASLNARPTSKREEIKEEKNWLVFEQS